MGECLQYDLRTDPGRIAHRDRQERSGGFTHADRVREPIMRHRSCGWRSSRSGDARHLARTAGTRTFQKNHIASRCAGFLPEQPARGRRFSQDVAIIFATSVARPPTPRYPPEHERTRRLHHDYRGRRPPAVARTHAGAPYGLPRPPGPTHRRCRLYLCNDRRDLSGRSGQVVIAAWKEYQDARAVADDDSNAVLNLERLPQVWSEEDREPVEVAFSIHAQHGGRRMAGHGPESVRRVIARVAHPRSLASGQRSRSAGGRSRPNLRRITPAT